MMNQSPSAAAPRPRGPRPVDPNVLLARIDARLARLEKVVEPLGELPAAVATAADILDEEALALGDVDARVRGTLDLVERLSRPATLETLRKLVDVVEQAPDMLATGADIFDEIMEEAGREGLNLPNLVEDVKGLVMMLLRVAPRVHQLLDSGMLDERTIRTLGGVGKAVAEANEVEPPRVGLFGAMRAMRDSDIKRAVGFALRVGVGFGKTLKRESKRLKG